jgi:hypothetical protein
MTTTVRSVDSPVTVASVREASGSGPAAGAAGAPGRDILLAALVVSRGSLFAATLVLAVWRVATGG